jgi:hypothetical protein
MEVGTITAQLLQEERSPTSTLKPDSPAKDSAQSFAHTTEAESSSSSSSSQALTAEVHLDGGMQ